MLTNGEASLVNSSSSYSYEESEDEVNPEVLSKSCNRSRQNVNYASDIESKLPAEPETLIICNIKVTIIEI